MDESSAFLLVGLGFFLVVFLLCFMLEQYRKERDERLETMRHDRRIAEQREFGHQPVQEAIARQQSIRRFVS